MQPSPRAALSGSQRIQAMMEHVKATDALSPADMSQIIQRVQAASPAKVPQSPARSRESSGRGRRISGFAAKQGDDAVPSPSNTEKFEWEVEAKDIICVRLLGSGSFGEVWRGVWLGTPIAVKKVRCSWSFSSGVVRATQRHHATFFRYASGQLSIRRRNEISGGKLTF